MTQSRDSEALVVTGPDAAGATDVLRSIQVTQSFGPRIFMVVGARSALESLRVRPGVEAVLVDPEDPLPEGLNDREALFVEAWRQHAQPKRRRGDGMAWDAPGFQPPDGPGQSAP